MGSKIFFCNTYLSKPFWHLWMSFQAWEDHWRLHVSMYIKYFYDFMLRKLNYTGFSFIIFKVSNTLLLSFTFYTIFWGVGICYRCHKKICVRNLPDITSCFSLEKLKKNCCEVSKTIQNFDRHMPKQICWQNEWRWTNMFYGKTMNLKFC